MRRIILSVIISISPFWIKAQTNIISIKEYNIENKLDSFETKVIENHFTTLVILGKDSSSINPKIDSLLFNGQKNTYIGPVHYNGYKSIYLIKEVVATYKMRVGQIYINPISKSDLEVDSIAKEILLRVKNGSSFDSMCKKYSHNYRDRYECDLGWFNSGEMIKEFELAVLDHKKGDVFQVKTTFGTHVVKVLEDSIEQFRNVTYIEIKIN